MEAYKGIGFPNYQLNLGRNSIRNKYNLLFKIAKFINTETTKASKEYNKVHKENRCEHSTFVSFVVNCISYTIDPW
jgi:hypothetical protein